jgi:hypothetical protein
MLIDEAHHMMPPEWATAATLPQQLQGMILVTNPGHLNMRLLRCRFAGHLSLSW